MMCAVRKILIIFFLINGIGLAIPGCTSSDRDIADAYDENIGAVHEATGGIFGKLDEDTEDYFDKKTSQPVKTGARPAAAQKNDIMHAHPAGTEISNPVPAKPANNVSISDIDTALRNAKNTEPAAPSMRSKLPPSQAMQRVKAYNVIFKHMQDVRLAASMELALVFLVIQDIEAIRSGREGDHAAARQKLLKQISQAKASLKARNSEMPPAAQTEFSEILFEQAALSKKIKALIYDLGESLAVSSGARRWKLAGSSAGGIY